jgi:HD-like signal output (HDOD) protein
MVDYYRIVELIRVYNLALWQVEEKLLGIDHATIGSLMAQKWNFPPVLVEAIRHHHAPSLAKSQQALSAIINIANALSKDAKYLLTDPAGNKIHPESLRILNVDESQLQTMATQLESFRTSFSNRG